MNLDGDSVNQFQEKPDGDNAWTNGGFFVLEPSVLDRVTRDQTSWESDVLPILAADGHLSAYRHLSLWQPMDILRDQQWLYVLLKRVAFSRLFFYAPYPLAFLLAFAGYSGKMTVWAVNS